eukprot:NODE_813_length_1175_cov_75.741412_g772_i0.p1 GENE.NODE_813_length_1175_cov_75.741412_g772_i0~~NODE_813_length_1175_cov_75.741412_g772_i0.p1  ORF type:complete len:365 (-),score=84.76 NODE_813_length_1175_cov_75.741412_g772_i0:79-1095(-)
MSHQSGIQVSEALDTLFKEAVQNDQIRLIKVSIRDESLVADAHENVQGTWEEDWSKIAGYLEDRSPCYILMRLDAQTSQGYAWAFLCYVPDYAKVRDKMLYASTRATLKKTLGDYRFKDDVYGNAKEDFTMQGFLKHRASVAAAPALTDREEEKNRQIKEESRVEVGITTKKAHVHGVHFPVSEAAQAELGRLRNGEVNYVQLSLNVSGESIELEKSTTIEASQLASLAPPDHPRYHFFVFHHAHEGNTLDSLIFIYSCPMSSQVKERMLYSSCKASVIAETEGLGLTIEKNAEVSDADEMTEQFVYDELHPKVFDQKKQFKKPMKPGRTGSRQKAQS